MSVKSWYSFFYEFYKWPGQRNGPSRRVPLCWIKSGEASDHTPKFTSQKGLTSLISSKLMSSLVIARVVLLKPPDCDYNRNNLLEFYSSLQTHPLTTKSSFGQKKTFQVLVLRSFSLPYKVNVSHPIKQWPIRLISKKILLWTNVYRRVD